MAWPLGRPTRSARRPDAAPLGRRIRSAHGAPPRSGLPGIGQRLVRGSPRRRPPALRKVGIGTGHGRQPIVSLGTSPGRPAAGQALRSPHCLLARCQPAFQTPRPQCAAPRRRTNGGRTRLPRRGPAPRPFPPPGGCEQILPGRRGPQRMGRVGRPLRPARHTPGEDGQAGPPTGRRPPALCPRIPFVPPDCHTTAGAAHERLVLPSLHAHPQGQVAALGPPRPCGRLVVPAQRGPRGHGQRPRAHPAASERPMAGALPPHSGRPALALVPARTGT